MLLSITTFYRSTLFNLRKKSYDMNFKYDRWRIDRKNYVDTFIQHIKY